MNISPKKKDIAIVVPVYNEELTIRQLIRECNVYGDVIAVDDLSDDQTVRIAKSEQCEVIHMDKRSGYSRAVNTGIEYALSLGYEKVITIDADLEISPSYLKEVIECLDAGYIFVYGERNWKRRFAERLIGRLSFVIWGARDVYCGLKGFSCHTLEYIGVPPSKLNDINTYYGLSCLYLGYKSCSVKVHVKESRRASRFGTGLLCELRMLISFGNVIGRILLRSTRMPTYLVEGLKGKA